MSAVDLLPCPFCGKAPHVSPVSGGMMASCDPCMIDMLVPDWNRRAPVSAGKVKALVWERGVVDWAKPLPGMKYVACSTTPAGSWAFWLDEAPETRAVFPSEAEAKAAAQADYEARILSALQPGDGWQGNGQRFKIGQKVQISSTYEHAGEWRDQVLTIIGVDLEPDGVTHSYTTAEGVTRRGTWCCPADGWSETDLSPASLLQGEETK